MPPAIQPTRREFLRASASGAATLALGAGGAFRRDVSWLAEVQRPPKLVEADRLAPLLEDAAGRAITTLTEWQRERDRLRKRWLDFLGPMTDEAPPVELEVLREDRPEGCLRQLVRYESEPGERVEAYLLRPEPDVPGRDADGRRAALVALHQTTNDSIDEIAGVRGPPGQHLGLKLARRGFVVFCPRCFLWQDGRDYQQAVERFRARRPRTLGMHKMLWDARRGVDALGTLVDTVDPRRIGAVGHSLGAKEALYLAAFDERVAATVASEGGVGFSFTNWDAPWYLGDGIRQAGFSLAHHQLLALAAPRPFLILAGESGPGAADGDRTWPYLEAALPVWRLYGEPPQVGLYNHREGHTLSELTFVRLAEWLTVYLSQQ